MDLKAGKLKSTWSDQTWYYLCFSYWKLHTSLNHTICDQRLIPFKLGIISHVTFNSSVTMIVWIFGRSLRLWGNDMVLDPTVKKTLPNRGSMSMSRPKKRHFESLPYFAMISLQGSKTTQECCCWFVRVLLASMGWGCHFFSSMLLQQPFPGSGDEEGKSSTSRCRTQLAVVIHTIYLYFGFIFVKIQIQKIRNHEIS